MISALLAILMMAFGIHYHDPLYFIAAAIFDYASVKEYTWYDFKSLIKSLLENIS